MKFSLVPEKTKQKQKNPALRDEGDKAELESKLDCLLMVYVCVRA